MRPETAHSYTARAELHAACGRADEARDHLSRARDLFRAAGMADWLVQVRAAPAC